MPNTYPLLQHLITDSLPKLIPFFFTPHITVLSDSSISLLPLPSVQRSCNFFAFLPVVLLSFNIVFFIQSPLCILTGLFEVQVSLNLCFPTLFKLVGSYMLLREAFLDLLGYVTFLSLLSWCQVPSLYGFTTVLHFIFI